VNHVCAFFNTIDEEHRVLGTFYKDGIWAKRLPTLWKPRSGKTRIKALKINKGQFKYC
jgi:hypothetical protein